MEAGTTSPARTRRTPTVRVAAVITAAAMVGAGAGIAAHLLSARGTVPRIALPDLHGQATWAAGARQAPRFTLRDVLGGSASLASARGHVVLVTFLDSRCRTLCPLIGRAIGDVQRSLPASARPVVFVVSVDPKGDGTASVRAAARRWGLAPGWHWLSGSRQELAGVWRSYGIAVQPTSNDIVHGAAVYLVDRRGYERAGYLAPLLPNFLALDIERVAREQA